MSLGSGLRPPSPSLGQCNASQRRSTFDSRNSHRNEEETHVEKNPEVQRGMARKRDKSRARDLSQPPVSEMLPYVEPETFETSILNERMVMVETGLWALHCSINAAENNLCSLESVALEGLGEVKGNILEQDEEHKEGMTHLELKLCLPAS